MSVGLKFGLILGLISIVLHLVQYAIGINPMDNQWISNSISVITTVAVIVFAHKSYKETGNGYMSYGQGLGLAMVTVVSSLVIGGLYTFIFFNFIDPSAFEAIWEKAAADMEAQGQSEEAIEMGMSWGRKLFWPLFILGGLFWGFILGLIVTIFTQKKEPETAF
jgi:hypothetical protein